MEKKFFTLNSSDAKSFEILLFHQIFIKWDQSVWVSVSFCCHKFYQKAFFVRSLKLLDFFTWHWWT